MPPPPRHGAGRLSTQLLGFPPEARLLLVNCDDLGMHTSINMAVLDAVRQGIATSTSVMVPGPAAPHAFRLLHRSPQIPFGIHLTLTRDGPSHAWRPVSPPGDVPSIVDDAGLLLLGSDTSTLLSRAHIEDVDRELRAQLGVAERAGLSPTHLDWHVMADGGRDDILQLTLALAAEHSLAARVWLAPARLLARERGLPVVDHDFLDSFSLPVAGKADRYLRLLHDLPAGLTEWAVHPAVGPPTAQQIDLGWDVRVSDHKFLVSPRAADSVTDEGIVLVDYRRIQDAWNAAAKTASRPPHTASP